VGSASPTGTDVESIYRQFQTVVHSPGQGVMWPRPLRTPLMRPRRGQSGHRRVWTPLIQPQRDSLRTQTAGRPHGRPLILGFASGGQAWRTPAPSPLFGAELSGVGSARLRLCPRTCVVNRHRKRGGSRRSCALRQQDRPRSPDVQHRLDGVAHWHTGRPCQTPGGICATSPAG
jgi:hypothetical protein